MSCEICDRSPLTHDVALHRLNVRGVTGRWTCQDHARVFGSYNRQLAGKADPGKRPMSDAEIDDCTNQYLAKNGKPHERS